MIKERLKKLRLQNNLTQTALGDISGVSNVQIARYENGRNKPSTKTLAKLAKVLGVNPSFFTYKKKHLEEICLVEHLERLKTAEIQFENAKVERDNLQSKAKILNRLIKAFAKYLEIQGQIIEKDKTHKTLKDEKSKIDVEIEKVKRKLVDENAVLKGLVTKKSAIEKEKRTIPKLKKDLERVNEGVSSSENKIDKLKETTEINRLDLDKIIEQIAELELVKKEALDGQYAFTSISDNKRLKKVIEDLQKKSEQKFDLTNELKKLEEDITAQEEFNTTIEGFIASGLEIVNQSETDSCPLCEQQYDSYKTMADKISNNKALSASLKILFEQKTKLVDTITKMDTETEKLLNELVAYYDAELKILKERKVQSEKNIAEDEKLMKNAERDLAKLKKEGAELASKTDGEPIDDFLKTLDVSLKEVTDKLATIKNTLAKTNVKLQGLEKDEKGKTGRIELIVSEIEALKSEKDIIEIENWFDDNNPGEKIEIEFLQEETNSNASALKDVLELLESNSIEVKRIKKILKPLRKSDQQKKLTSATERKKDIEKKIAAYERHLDGILDDEIQGLNNEKLTSLLSEKENEIKADLEALRKRLEDYKMLEKYTQNIVPFLEMKNAKMELAEKEKELAFIKKSVTPILNGEVKKTREFLEKKIKDFFYVELINEIYEKIDPHPDFKSVEFRANFDSGSPSLDVFVKNNDNQSRLIPNLYFSTAQINILSLSIFLASALNSKEYDCIFIDDPIQSMDSINVLSTIDLLRSLVVNQDKQIILSTHDQNFHNLLKKKMPNNLFRSKFMELESFGKVKEDRLLAQ